MKKQTKIKIIEGFTLIIAILFMGFFYMKELGNWRYLGILGFVITGFMWQLPQGLQNKFEDDKIQ